MIMFDAIKFKSIDSDGCSNNLCVFPLHQNVLFTSFFSVYFVLVLSHIFAHFMSTVCSKYKLQFVFSHIPIIDLINVIASLNNNNQ